jgi:selenocysteine lyase/cysteine desulfurase
MNLDRRTFIQNLSVGTVGAFAFGATSRAANNAAPVSPPVAALPAFNASTSDAYWRAVRAQFPLLENPVYLNVGGLGPTPQPVLDKVFSTMLKLQEHSETGYSLIEPARETVAKFLGAKPSEICFTRNATEGNDIIASGLALKEGDEVIFESHAHPGGSFPWFNQAKLRGIVVKLFEPDSSSPEANLTRIRALVTPRTKVIQVSHITCTNGLVMPVHAIAEFCATRDIWFHIDGAQAVGMIPVNINAIGCDSYAISGHKWLGASHESGVFYLRIDKLESIAVTSIGAHSAELPFLPGELKYADSAERYEYGTRNAGTIVGVAEAVDLQERIGIERIAAYGREMATYLQLELGRIAGIELLTSRHDDLRGSITTIRHPRADASKFFGYLMTEHHLRCRPVHEQKLNALRISTHVFNSHAECERVVAGVKASIKAL